MTDYPQRPSPTDTQSKTCILFAIVPAWYGIPLEFERAQLRPVLDIAS
jgi:hypothetical protein